MSMKKISGIVLSVIAPLLLAVLPAWGSPWRDVKPGDAVILPRDFYFQREYRVQWWYFTGHLYDASGREFGFELTFFSAGLQRRSYRSRFGVDFVYLSHVAVSDIENGTFLQYSDADSGAYGFGGADGRRLRVRVGGATLEGSPERMHVRARGKDIGLDLVLKPAKRTVLHGDRGYSRKSEASPLDASLYFSFTALDTAGTITVNGRAFRISGKSWFDRELWSRAGSEAGWDWFAFQLDDQREIMLYRIRKTDGSIDAYSSGTVVYRDGTYRSLGKNDFTLKPLGYYTSRKTGKRYPSRWKVLIPSEGLTLVVTPLIEDQEFTEAGAIRNIYWEGACRVEGTVAGRAYGELTGY